MADHVYLSVTFGNIEREKAEKIVQDIEEMAGDTDFSVDWSDPIGEDAPTPVADQAADAVGGDPTAEDSSDPDVQPGVGDSLPPAQEPQQSTEETPATPADQPTDS